MSEIQSIIFNKEKYSIERARYWLFINDLKYYGKVDIKKNTYRFRQTNPNKYRHFRTKKISNGITLVLGFK